MENRLPPEIQLQLAELKTRQTAQSSLEKYRQFISPSAHVDFIYPPAAHHEIIQHELEQLVLNDQYDGIIISAPPGSAKSTYANVQFPTWYLGNNPDHKIVCASNNTTLAEGFARRRKSVCQTQEWTLFSGTKIDKDHQAVGDFGTTAGGSMLALGVGSSITGQRADLLIIDDPITGAEQAYSPTQLDKMAEWYTEDARPRVKPDGFIVIIMTRWSRQDLIGKILQNMANNTEARRWAVLTFPMECDDPTNDPLNRNQGDLLWPEWYKPHQIKEAKQNHASWMRLWQQRPIDLTGTWVDEQYIQLITPNELPKEELQYITAVDLALSAGTGDYTAIITAGIDQKRNVYIVDVHRIQVPVGETLRKIEAIKAQYSPQLVLIEDDNNYKTMISVYREYSRENSHDSIPFYPFKIGGQDKETRAAPIRQWFMEGRVFILNAGWTQELTKEIAQFPPKSKSEHDDLIDAIGLIGRHLGKASAPTTVEIPKPKPTTQEMCLDDLFHDREDAINASRRGQSRI